MEYSRSSVLVNASHGCASSVLRASSMPLPCSVLGRWRRWRPDGRTRLISRNAAARSCERLDASGTSSDSPCAAPAPASYAASSEARKIGIRHRVGVDDHERVERRVLGEQQIHRPAKRLSLAAGVRSLADEHACTGGGRDRRGLVRAVVGHDDDLVALARNGLREQGRDGPADRKRLVVRRYEDDRARGSPHGGGPAPRKQPADRRREREHEEVRGGKRDETSRSDEQNREDVRGELLHRGQQHPGAGVASGILDALRMPDSSLFSSLARRSGPARAAE